MQNFTYRGLIVDWIYIAFFKAPKALNMEPIIHSHHIYIRGGELTFIQGNVG